MSWLEVGMDGKKQNRRTKSESNRNRNRMQPSNIRMDPNIYISKITELRTERIPEYIKILIMYTYKL